MQRIAETPDVGRCERRAGDGGSTSKRAKVSERVNFAVGIWDEAKELVFVEHFKGKQLQRMGTTIDGQHWLLPEESTYLVVNNKLRLKKSATCNEYMTYSEAYRYCFKGLSKHKLSIAEYSVYAKLAKQRYIIFKSESRKLPAECDSASNRASTDINLLYNVFEPRKDFKKSDPGTPSFRVVISPFHDKLPSLKHLEKLLQSQSSSHIPHKIALFDGQSVSFLGVEAFKPPKP